MRVDNIRNNMCPVTSLCRKISQVIIISQIIGQCSKATYGSEQFRSVCGLAGRSDAFDELTASIDIDASIAVGQTLGQCSSVIYGEGVRVYQT